MTELRPSPNPGGGAPVAAGNARPAPVTISPRAPAFATAVDWSTRPEPWSWIGPQFRAECERITGIAATRGDSLRARREKLGLSREQLAKCIKIKSSRIALAEQGQDNSIIKTLLAALDRYAVRGRPPRNSDTSGNGAT